MRGTVIGMASVVGMRFGWIALAGVVAGPLAADAAAVPARVTVTSVTPARPGWLRVAVRFDGTRRPLLRLVPDCRTATPGTSVVGAQVTVAAARRQAFLDVPDDLAWLTDSRRQPCEVTGLAVEMVRGQTVVARAPVPVTLPPAYPPPPLPASARAREDVPRLAFATAKRGAPEASSAEAGILWSLDQHVGVAVSFERTDLGTTVPHDSGNGIRTSLRFGF